MAGLLGIDAGMGDVTSGQRVTQDRIVPTGRLHHDEAGRFAQAIDPCRYRLGGVGDAAARAVAAMVEVEMMLGNVASNNEGV